MDDKFPSTYAILLMIIIAPRHAPKGGASVVIGACFCARHGFPMSSLPEFADLETLLCQGNFSADAARTRRSGRELHIQRAAVPQQSFPTRAGSSKEGGGIPPSASRIAPSSVIKALHFVYDR
jgi:hypothetical protein